MRMSMKITSNLTSARAHLTASAPFLTTTQRQFSLDRIVSIILALMGLSSATKQSSERLDNRTFRDIDWVTLFDLRLLSLVMEGARLIDSCRVLFRREVSGKAADRSTLLNAGILSRVGSELRRCFSLTTCLT